MTTTTTAVETDEEHREEDHTVASSRATDTDGALMAATSPSADDEDDDPKGETSGLSEANEEEKNGGESCDDEKKIIQALTCASAEAVNGVLAEVDIKMATASANIETETDPETHQCLGDKNEKVSHSSQDQKYAQEKKKSDDQDLGMVVPQPIEWDFAHDVQPLPAGGDAPNPPHSREPGAHAVPGRPPMCPPRPSPRPIDEDDQEQQEQEVEHHNVIHDVVVVVTDDEVSQASQNSTGREEEGHSQDQDPSAAFTARSRLSEEDQDGDCGWNNDHSMMTFNEEVIDAKILPEAAPSSSSYKSWFIMLAIFLVILSVLVLSLALIYDPNSSSSSSNQNSTSPVKTIVYSKDDQDRSIYPPFQEGLPPATVNFIEELHHPHWFANRWMLSDPNLETYSPERQLQRFHMASFYVTTNGDEWYRNDHWLSYTVHECEWFSQSDNPNIVHYDAHYDICDDKGHLLKLNLASNNLHGTFPLVKNFIQTLRTYDISDNRIHGAVPTASSLDIEVFIISRNDFEGHLVGEGGFGAFDVRVVKIDGNRLLGYHAPLYFMLPKLEVVNITDNLFSGTIPTEVQFSTNLQYFGYGQNKFEGTVPTELASLTALEAIDLSGNHLVTGSIPSELGDLEHLQHLDVSDTAVSGEVPASLCAAVEEEVLDVRCDCDRVECCG